VKNYFAKCAWILCILVVVAVIGVLVWRSGSEENGATYVLSGNYAVEMASEPSLPTPSIREIDDEPSPYRDHATPSCGEELYPVLADAPQVYLELPPPAIEPPRPRKSPSDLQLALFAHMAFFPFDFNEGSPPDFTRFGTFHYRPFLNYIIPEDANGQNRYGFSFAEEMEGWYWLFSFNADATDFSISVYSCAYGDTIILAIRGTDGNVATSLATRSGTWWCNFQAMVGYPHSHVGSLISFLDGSATPDIVDIFNLLDGADIYITGHSLGGYLAYVATYELTQMGFEDNIKRVVAFSAPIFDVSTVEMIAALKPTTRSRITHYYVPEDLIAGFVGVEMTSDFHVYGTFELTSRLFGTLRDVRNVDVPPTIYALSNLMIGVEERLPFGLPYYFAELIWRLNGAMGTEALAITNEFRSLVQHVPLAQTWHTPRAYPSRPADASLPYILRNHTPELISEIVIDMMVRIFDADTHFMMNFYPHLVPLND